MLLPGLPAWGEKLKQEHDTMREEHDKMKQENERLKKELEVIVESHQQVLSQCAKPLKNEERVGYDEIDFQGNDNKVRFHTGLTDWETLSKLFEFVRPHLLGHSSLKPFQQLMMTLMRLRLGSSGVELGYLFGIHPSTVSRIFSDVIEMLYIYA